MANIFKKLKNKYLIHYKLLNDSKRFIKYNLGSLYLENEYHIEGDKKTYEETNKMPYRYDIINFILEFLNRDTKYLEIGVRYPKENFDKIKATRKYSVDPGKENIENPVNFKLTSDEFFQKIRDESILNKDIKFDVIFIDGLHLAEQVERDITNSLGFLKEDGFIVLHDCNPPTEFHASETYKYRLSPSKGCWNGTTWKAFFKIRQSTSLNSCCIDSDWGIGIISKKIKFGESILVENPYFEYNVFKENRKESLNLMSFEDFKVILNKG
tara:strand:+ start:51697 stop:52503 length:807 start_codon:yes stop_codon:yes gene_type:complete